MGLMQKFDTKKLRFIITNNKIVHGKEYQICWLKIVRTNNNLLVGLNT